MRARWPVFLLLALSPLLVYPQYKPFYNQYNFTYGTKAMSMGNAFSAVADDLTAVFWNPAGLADKRNPEFYFAYQAESLKQEYDPQESDYLGTRLRYDFSLASKLKQINFFSVSAPAEFWKMKWGFALSYYRFIPYGFKGAAVGDHRLLQPGLHRSAVFQLGQPAPAAREPGRGVPRAV
jgi:hypothetical protein